MLLIGCKADLAPARRQVTREEGQQLAAELQCPFYEASAKDNVNVTEAFMTAARIGLRLQNVMLLKSLPLRGKSNHCYKRHALRDCTFAAFSEDDCRFCSVCRAVVANGSAGAQCQSCAYYLCSSCLPASDKERDLEKAFSEIHQWANANNPHALFFLGMSHANGETVEQDLEGAAKWLKRAADQGHTDAQFVLGKLYAEGRGVQKSHLKALDLFVLAADQQHAAANSKLRTMKLTELHLSAVRGSLDSVKALLDADADLYAVDTCVTMCPSADASQLHQAPPPAAALGCCMWSCLCAAGAACGKSRY
jgi:hypothetical protein